MIIPSYLSAGPKGAIEDVGNMTNDSLRVGEIKEIVFPGNKRSISKKFIEYTIDVAHRDGYGPEVTTTYNGCIVANMFGLGSDTLRYTLRADSLNDPTKNRVLGVGSKVLLLCINGSKARSIIIGGVRDGETGDVGDSADDGHNLFFCFNGLQATINNEGEFLLTNLGPTKADGSNRDDVFPENTGAYITMDKDGNVELACSPIDTPSKITINNHDSSITLSSVGVLITNAPDGTTITSDNGNVEVFTNNVYLGGATAARDGMVMGTTYRNDESSMNTTMLTQLTTIVTALGILAGLHTAAGVGINAAAVFHIVPVVGPILGAIPLTAAGVAVNAMTPAIVTMTTAVGQMIAALTQFEAKAVTHVSKKNFLDYQ